MARGYSTAGDIIKTDVQGADLAAVWREFAATLDLRNNEQDNLASLLCFKTTAAGDLVPQTSELEDFEDASEFGVPKGIRGPHDILTLGFNLKWRDLAARYTYRFLAEADRDQIEAVHNRALASDNRQVFEAILGALFNNTARLNPEGLAVQPLYNGDGTIPPEWNGRSFDGDHSHYLISGSATFDGGDIADAHRMLAHHGYGDPSVGGRILVFLNPDQAEVTRGFRRGTTSADPYDFVPSTSAPAYLTTEQIVGDRAPANFGRISIFGSYGPAWLSETHLVPSGYVVAVATYGANDTRNPIGFREHLRSNLRGLRQIGGASEDYPLQDSYYQRVFGTGVRQRGGAAVIQVKAAGTYDVPTAYETVLA